MEQHPRLRSRWHAAGEGAGYAYPPGRPRSARAAGVCLRAGRGPLRRQCLQGRLAGAALRRETRSRRQASLPARSTPSSTRPIRVWLIPSTSPSGRTRISTFPARTRTSSVGTTVRRRPTGTRGRRCRIRRRSRTRTRSISCPARSSPRKNTPRDGLRAVRGAIFGPDGDLYVADRDADSVKRYDGGSGAFRAGVPPPASHHAGPPRVPHARRRAPGRQPRRSTRSLPSIPKSGR